MSLRLLWAFVVLGFLGGLAVCYGIATHQILLGSREGRWVYGYLQPFRLWSLGAAALASAGCIGLLSATTLPFLRRDWQRILAWMLLALAVQALLRSMTPYSFAQMFASDGANSFYGVTRTTSAWTAISDFDRAHEQWPLHAQSNMPGKVMLVFALRSISTQPGALAWLTVILSNLGGALMYLFVRDVFDDRRMALYAAILYFFVPAKLFFFPLLNTVTPVVVLSCACLLTRWLRTGLAVYPALLGIALYGLVFFEPMPLVMGLLFAALLARAIWQGDLTRRELLLQGTMVPLTFGATYLALYTTVGFDLLGSFRRIGAQAITFNDQLRRPYAIWVRENVREFLFGIGACQVLLVIAALADGVRRTDTGPRLVRPIVVVTLSLIAVLAATDLIGINRAEVTRLWIYLACFFQIPAAYVCARLESAAALALVLAVTLLEGALGTAMIGFILPG